MRITERAHEAVRQVVREGESAIDATLGNGHDTLFLADCVGAEGLVVGFDVQEEAVEATRRRLREAGIGDSRVRLLRAGHETIGETVHGPIAAAMFNLGYLPGGDHAMITRAETSLEGLRQSWALLRPGGLLSVVCYRGHPGGPEEARQVCQWAETLERAEVEINGREETECGPFLVTVRRR